MNKLIADIKTWRNETLGDFANKFAELTVQIVLPDPKIVAIAGKAKNMGSEDDLIVALEECGYSIPESFISSHTKDLYRCISSSLDSQGKPSIASTPTTIRQSRGSRR
jgi:hypothetical protein